MLSNIVTTGLPRNSLDIMMMSVVYYANTLSLNMHSASSLKPQSMGRHIVSLGHSILNPSQPVICLTPERCLRCGETTNTHLRPDREQRFTVLAATSALTMIPSMRFIFIPFSYNNRNVYLKHSNGLTLSYDLFDWTINYQLKLAPSWS